MSYPAAAAVLEKAVQTLLLAGRARPLVASSHLCVIQLDYVCFLITTMFQLDYVC
jgi:hypothetical protein